jgi:hypothetical protein
MQSNSISITFDKAKRVLAKNYEIVIVPKEGTLKEFDEIQEKLGAKPYFDDELGDLKVYPYYRFRMNETSCLTKYADVHETLYNLNNYLSSPEW